MSFLQYLKGWLGGAANRAGTRRQPLRRRPSSLERRVQPALEQLECRELLSGLTVAILNAPATGHVAEGKPIYLSSVLKGTTPGVAYTYSWQVLKDNVAFTISSSSVLAFMPNDDAAYQITLDVHGKNGSTATTSQTITVDDVAPTVYLSPYFSGTALTALPFRAAATSPSAADRAAGFTYSWNFGDGTTGTGAAPMHVYAAPGKYTVTLSVTDAGGGLQKTVGAIVNVAAPRAPGVIITGMPSYGYSPEGTTVTLGSVLRGTTPGVTYTYAWRVLKGTTDFASGTNASISFTPDDAGVYKVYLTVTDQFGTAVTRSLGLYIYDKPPTVQLSPQFAADLGSPITFSATVTDPGPLDMAAGFRYLWYFGDGTTSHDATPSHTYAKNGYYPVRVIVTNADGLSTAAHALANIGKPVSAQFNGPSSVDAGTTTAQVSFTKQAGGIGSYTYSYDFGNTGTFEITGSNSPTAIIPESYVDSGPATLVVHGRITDSVGGSTDYTTTIQITDTPPTPSITFTPTVDAGEAGTFQGSATDPSTAMTKAGFTYSWNFGDGSAPVTGADPTYTYSKSGTYTVTLTATDADNVSGSTSITFTVSPMPTAIFSGPSSVDAGTTTAQVSFTSPAGGTGAYRYSYDFGDTGTFEIPFSNSPSPTAMIPESYVDSGPANLTVRGRITDSAGGYTDYLTTIAITDVPPTPSITFEPTVDAGEAGTFQGSATDPSTADTQAGFTYSWNFGDNSAPVSGADPSHTYSKAGTYTVTLTAADQYGKSSSTSVSFTVNSLPTATFSGPASVSAGTTTAQVSFTNQAGGSGGYTYTYQFGNSGAFSTNSPTTMIPESYVDSGPATLTVDGRITDSTGAFADYTTTIQITDTPPTPSITFTPTLDAGEADQQPFQGTATDPSNADTQAGFTYTWNFGDGSAPVTGADPSHTYTNAGTYTITLTATDQHNVSGSTSVSFTVNPMPTATFSGPSSVDAGTTNAQVTFTNQASGAGGYAYSYDFGNTGTFDIVGSPMPTATIPVSYLNSAPTTVTVRGRITDSAGGYTDYTTTIQVTDPPPTPSITLPPTVDAGQQAAFQGTATDANTADTPAGFTYSWDFGDGSAPVTGANPTYTYANAGTYTVTLTVTDQFGMSGSTSVSYTVDPLPTADFSGPPNVGAGTTTATVMFTNQTGGTGGYTYSYDFGNTGVFNIASSASSTATVPSSYLSTDGPHVIHARITDSIGGYTDYYFTINVNSA